MPSDDSSSHTSERSGHPVQPSTDPVAAAIDGAVRRFRLGSTLRPPLRPVEAWSTDIHRVWTDTGDYAVKVFGVDVGGRRADLDRGIGVERAALADQGIPMAEPISVPGEDGWLAEIDAPDGTRLARCHRWVDGLPATGTRATIATARDVGRSLGRLHALALDSGDSSQLPGVDLPRWRRAVTEAERHDLPWWHDLSEHTPLVEGLARQVDVLRGRRLPMRLSHGDLDPKNAVVRPDGRVALTDWDFAGPVLPGVELVVAATSFAGPPTDDQLVEAFLTAYREVGGDAAPAGPEELVLEAAQLDWLLRNVEGSLPDAPPERIILRQRIAQQLIASFGSDVETLLTWGERLA